MNKKIFLLGTLILILMVFISFSVIKQSSKINVKPVEKPLVEELSVYLPVTEEDPMFGSPGSPITVTEFFSLECPSCAKRHAEIISYIEKNPGTVRLLVKGIAQENWLGHKNIFPLLALQCAQDQNQYWNFLNLAIKPNKFNESTVDEIISTLNLNSATFKDCLQNEFYKNTIEKEQISLKNLGLSQVPNIFINNKKLNLTEDVKIADILNGVLSK